MATAFFFPSSSDMLIHMCVKRFELSHVRDFIAIEVLCVISWKWVVSNTTQETLYFFVKMSKAFIWIPSEFEFVSRPSRFICDRWQQRYIFSADTLKTEHDHWYGSWWNIKSKLVWQSAICNMSAWRTNPLLTTHLQMVTTPAGPCISALSNGLIKAVLTMPKAV